MKVIKRDGNIVEYNPEKLRQLSKSKWGGFKKRQSKRKRNTRNNWLCWRFEKSRILVEDIQDIIEES